MTATINITEKAARQIAKQLAKRGRGLGLKLAVKKSGCSGFAYLLDYADELTGQEAVFEAHGIKVVVPQADLPILDGLELDYRREGVNEAFQFNNPNVRATCGCGESFAVE